VSFPSGTFEDSICQPKYDDTLLQIARTVVLSDCFVVAEDALSADSVRLVIRHPDGTGKVSERDVPRYTADPRDTTADCSSCGGACSTGAWRYVDARTFCLECGLKKLVSDEFVLTVVNEVVGEADGGKE
jgi:hypothetical protein